jgi:hypothetical protein
MYTIVFNQSNNIMKTKLVPIIGQKTAEDICVQLEQNNISVKDVGNSYLLTHYKTNDEFDKIIIAICVHMNLEPQDDKWFPGSPTDSEETMADDNDFGYYVCPVDPEEYDGNDFDMFISKAEITWC